MKPFYWPPRWSTDSDRATLTVLKSTPTYNLHQLPEVFLKSRRRFQITIAFITFMVLGVIGATIFLDVRIWHINSSQLTDVDPTGALHVHGTLEHMSTASISVETLVLFAEVQLASQVAADYDIQGSVYEDLGVHIKYPTLDRYRDAMRTAWEYWFEPNDVHSHPEGAIFTSWRDSIMAYLDLAGLRGVDDQIPKIIYTTSQEKVPDYVEQFKSWKKLNPDWEIVNFDDAATLEWLRTTFTVGNGSSARYARLANEFSSLNRGVLKGGCESDRMNNARG
jgi:hypothetical protein